MQRREIVWFSALLLLELATFVFRGMWAHHLNKVDHRTKLRVDTLLTAMMMMLGPPCFPFLDGVAHPKKKHGQ